MPPKDKYTDPQLRDQVKQEIQDSDKGGAPGQWSARKAQFMASEYKKRGGSYSTDKESGQDESQKNLEKWNDEEWQTKEGSGKAKNDDGSRKRYLPKKAWEQMDDSEKEATDNKKKAESKEGKQFVSNTDKAKGARKNVSEKDQEDGSDGQEEEKSPAKKGQQKNTNSKNSKLKKGDENKGKNSDDDQEGGDAEYKEDGSNAEEEEEEEEEESKSASSNTSSNKENSRGAKRKASSKDESSSKKQKGSPNSARKGAQDDASKSGSYGSKHDNPEAPAPQGSTKRLPKKGQTISWKAMPGWVKGKVLEIVTTNKSIKGKSIKASKDDPRIALEAESGKFCVHKPDACFFD